MPSADLLQLVEFERVSPDLIEAMGRYPVAVAGDMAGRRGAMNGRVQGLGRGMRFAGPALTIEVRPGDNLMIHVALAMAKPGDVLVIDGKNDQTCALIGELLVTQAIATGISAFVVDGAVRDTAELENGKMAIFASGRNPCGPTKNIPGRIGIPVGCGGVSVQPGDLVMGDSDGVIVFPRAEVADVLKTLDGKMAAEAQRLKEISEGQLPSPWLDQAMRDAGLIGDDESFIAACERR